jgi:ATP-dependent Zn protease
MSMLVPPPAAVGPVHIPPPDDREPKVRPKALLWDRIKILVFLSAFILLSAAYLHSQIPIMSFGEALRDQLRAKWWIEVIMGLEVLRQIHYLISERSPGYYQFWQGKVFGGWERRMGRMNPWNRYRLQRTVKWLIALTLIFLFFAWKWDVSFFTAIAEAPGRIWDTLFSPMTGMPLVGYLFFYGIMGVFSLVFFYAIFFFGGIDHFKPGEIKTRFADIWGQDPVLRRVKENVDLLERPEEIEAKGGHVPSGILLWGPPGTGKTLMAEAVAGETGKPYTFCDPSAFIQTFIGVAPMKVKWLYRKLRKQALRNGGCVVFFDEADALGNRGQLGNPGQQAVNPAVNSWEAMHTCNGMHYVSTASARSIWTDVMAQQPAAEAPRKRGFIIAGGGGGGGFSGALQALLTEMSGLNKPRGFFSRRFRAFLCIKPKRPPKYRILHIFATNQPNALDEALLRPGRIDRIYKVGYPHADGRRRTYEGYLNKVRNDLTPAQVERLAVISPYFTGAKIKDIVNEALIIAMREGRDVVTYQDMLKAKQNKGHGEADDWQYNELERHQVAIHEASHAVTMYLLQKRTTIDTATIERRGDVGGFVQPIPLEERFTEWRSEREIDVMTFLASLAGERLFFGGDNSAGVFGDLRGATTIVTESLAFAGMGDTIMSRTVTLAPANAQPVLDGSDRRFFESELGRQVEVRLQELLARVGGLLEEHQSFVFAVAHALETHLTITGEDVDAIYRGVPGPGVEGWMYHTDDFRLSYEAYHLSAAEAHLRQGKPEHKLPDIRSNASRWAAPAAAHLGPSVPPPPPGRSPWAPPRPPHGNGAGGNGHHNEPH